MKYLLLTIILSTLLLGCINSNTKSQEELLKEKQEQLELQRIENARIDSLSFYKANANSNLEARKLTIAALYLDTALHFANADEKADIIGVRASILYELKSYESAIVDYSELLAIDVNSKKDNFYLRALCFNKLRKTQEAVNDLKEAVKLRNAEAAELHNKINPIRKRVAYYVTRCCDGSTSNSTGRGTCSHHGGVCNWSEPVYEEYRKY